jgi:hypothetical protein
LINEVVDKTNMTRDARERLPIDRYFPGIFEIYDTSLSNPLQDDNPINVKIAQRFRKVTT